MEFNEGKKKKNLQWCARFVHDLLCTMFFKKKWLAAGARRCLPGIHYLTWDRGNALGQGMLFYFWVCEQVSKAGKSLQENLGGKPFEQACK